MPDGTFLSSQTVEMVVIKKENKKTVYVQLLVSRNPHLFLKKKNTITTAATVTSRAVAGGMNLGGKELRAVDSGKRQKSHGK